MHNIFKNLDPKYYSVAIIDLKKITNNYQYLRKQTNAEVAAVVKANCYGLGAVEITKTLIKNGCTNFFVAQIEEGITLRKISNDINIYIFQGVFEGNENEFLHNNLIPVLNNISQIETWNKFCKTIQKKLPCIIQFDSGMHRNGLDFEEIKFLKNNHDYFNELNISYYLSHIASSEDKNCKFNNEQLETFKSILSNFPKQKVCFSNTGGIFLGKEYHFDMVRPGIGIYGYFEDQNLQPCLEVYAKILQIHKANKGDNIGYNQTCTLKRDSIIATIAAGYADGLSRMLSNNGMVYINNSKCHILGRVSMDTIVVDITDLNHNEIKIGDFAEIIGNNISVFEVAKNSNTITYEVLTSLGNRYHKVYIN